MLGRPWSGGDLPRSPLPFHHPATGALTVRRCRTTTKLFKTVCLAMALAVMMVMMAGRVRSAAAATSPAPARYSGALVFADGIKLTEVRSFGDLRLVRGKDASFPLSLGAGGSLKLRLGHQGKFFLRLKGIQIAAFEVRRDKAGLVVSGLPSAIKLPFSRLVELRPPTRRVVKVDPKTGRKRSRNQPLELDWERAEAELIQGASRVKLKLLPGPRQVRLVPLPGKVSYDTALLVRVPGCRPLLTLLPPLKAGQEGRLAGRSHRFSLRPFQAKRNSLGSLTLYGGRLVYQVHQKTYYWLHRLRDRQTGRESLWLLSYQRKTGQGGAKLLPMAPHILRGAREALYLDDQGRLCLHLAPRVRKKGEQGRCFRLDAHGNLQKTADCVYPLFSFRGRVFKGNQWIIPNLDGLPLQMGSNVIQVTAVAEYGGRRSNVSASYDLEVAGPVPHLAKAPSPTKCTGEPTNPHSDDQRLCLDPTVPASFLKGPPPQNTCGKQCAGAKGEALKGCLQRCNHKHGQTMRGWSNYRPTPPCYADLISGKAMAAGQTFQYVYPVKIRRPSAYGPDNKPIAWGEQTHILSGLPPLRGAITLLTARQGFKVVAGPLNLYEGPYPELRYLARRLDAQGRPQKGEPEVIKVYPFNYRARVDKHQVKVDRSGLLVPGDPKQDSDGDGVPDTKDQCPNTPPGTAVNPQGCPTRDWLRVLSPDPERDQALDPSAPPQVLIKLRYGLESAPSGILRVVALHASGAIFKKDYALRAPGGELTIAFKPKRAPGSPRFAVAMRLSTAKSPKGPRQRIYYHFASGAFTVKLESEKEIAAHPKNRTQVTATITGPDGAPLKDRDFEVSLVAGKPDFLDGEGWLGHRGGASLMLHSDQQGRLRFTYLPPGVVYQKTRGWLRPWRHFPVKVILEFRDRADRQQKARTSLELISPFPRIVRFFVPTGDRAGHWQNVDSILEIQDADDERFTVRLYGPGQFGYAGGHNFQEVMEAPGVTSPFRFRFKSRPFGLDLNGIPSNWDIVKNFGEVNLKGLGRLALLMGGEWLLKTKWVRGAGKGGQKAGAALAKKLKVIKQCKDATPKATWATHVMYSGDAVAGGYKNLMEGGDTLYQTPTDLATSGGMGTGYRQDAIMDGLHAGVGIMDTVIGAYEIWRDAAPPSLAVQTELIKVGYDNIKTFYSVYRQFEDVAKSWEDVMYLPLLAVVRDAEGHETRRMMRYMVRFSKLEGQP